MLEYYEDVPDDVLAMKVVGTITHEDYVGSLIPKAEAIIKKHGRIKVLYVIGEEFKDFETRALWDDTKFGISHWNDISHAAIVTDLKWVESMATFFTPLMPCEVSLFKTDELDKAKKWIAKATLRKVA